MGAMVIGQGVFAAPVLFFVPALDPASFPLMLVGVTLHPGYQFLLAS